MSIEGILIGLLGIALGAAFCFAGFRYFLLLLPIWGLFAGFVTGAAATAALLGEGFLGSVIGIGVGVVVAIVFALLSWFYWWGAVVVIAGTLGFAITQAILEVIGFSADGFLTTLIALAGGVAVAVAALAVNAPKYIAIFLTAVAGASWLTAGVALMLGVVKTTDLDQGPLAALYQSSGILWILLWAGLAIAGIIAQVQMTKRWEQDIVVTY
ncbi:MAG TPA: DUF4203 domain-containing protein, partial [Candidatus Limnocylindrales bacterium]|nr:DUF4203 domain-containing protein [Candidatus Limnocylindrales bacterium]